MEWLLAGLGLMLVVEGLMPLLSPSTWRKTFERMLQFQDGQLRFVGLLSVMAGLAFLWFANMF
jgi:uncharacterized protein